MTTKFFYVQGRPAPAAAAPVATAATAAEALRSLCGFVMDGWQVPHFLMGIVAGAGILGFFMLVCGFFQPRNQLPRPVFYYPMHFFVVPDLRFLRCVPL